MKNQKFFYIYNLRQARYFIDKGLVALDVNRGNKGDIYVKFLRDQKSEEVFTQWIEYISNAND